MNKTSPLTLAAFLLAPLTPLHAAEAPPVPAKPNILLILSDDSGYGDLGCYGGEIDTPNLDKLAREGVRFCQFYNNARCSPSRATLLTGRDSAEVGFGAGTLGSWSKEMREPAYRARLPYNTPLLPELLKPAGYRTLMAGKWHLGGSLLKTGHASPKVWQRMHPGWKLTQEEIDADFNALPKQRGFDEFFGFLSGETHQFITPVSPANSAFAETNLSGHVYLDGNEPAKLQATRVYSMRCFSENTKHYPYNPADGTTGPAWYATDGITDKAIGMIQRARADKQPFFLYLAYQSPHRPLQAPQELVNKYLARYQDLGKVEVNRIQGLIKEGILPIGTSYIKTFSGNQTMSPKRKENFRQQIAIHAAMVEKMDENVGRVVAALKQSGQFDNTLIIYFSDNGADSHVGDLMNKPYRGCKALLWEGGPKTAFLAHWTGHIKPGTLNTTVGWIGDLLPTCLAVAGTSYLAEFRGSKLAPLDGRNLVPALEGATMPPPEYLFTNDKGQQGVVYQGRWKLLINPGWYANTRKNPHVVYELYDLSTDPTETKNIASSKPDMVEQLAEVCAQWQKKEGIVDYGEMLKKRPDFSE